ncbi:EAL domain-containing protein [Bacillus sp. 2205SS5-2]|uniref:EAL domain-containing protein n=1 Tax=Bacillus sp. 2205SS5-2 TaxID=3109031 RepID=UPI0030052690
MNIFDFFQEDVIYHEYQPLFSLDSGNELYAVEALLRNASNVNPESVFQSAIRANILYKLDTLSIQKAVESFLDSSTSTCKLFLNIYITTILHPNFLRFFQSLLQPHPDLAHRLVLEVNESSAEEMWNNPLLKQKLNELRQVGIMFAIDDFGQGSSSIKKAIEYEPECIKLDRYFAIDLAKDERKQRFLSMFKSFYEKDTILVLEGIETKEDLLVAQQLGIDIGQGYYLGKPKALFAG